MTDKGKLFLVVAAFTTSACAHTEQAQQPPTVEHAEEPAPVAAPEPAKPATTSPTRSSCDEGPMDKETCLSFRGVITKPGARP